MNEPIIEALKELLRVTLLAVVPILIVSLESGNLDLKLIGVVAAIAALRALDKWLYLWGKEVERTDFDKGKLLQGGLTRF